MGQLKVFIYVTSVILLLSGIAIVEDVESIGFISEVQQTYVKALADTPWPMFRHDLNHTGLSPYNTTTNYGSMRWSYYVGYWTSSSPTIGPEGTIYIGWADYSLYAFNPDGTLKWKFVMGNTVVSTPAIDENGIIYVGSTDFYIYAINPDGTLRWKYLTGDMVISSPAIGPDGTIYVGSNDGYLYVLNPDGTLRWRYLTGGVVRSSPAIGTDGTIYVGSGDGKVYAINPDGTLKWTFSTGGTVYSSPAIGPDGTIYVGSYDNCLYAINPDGTLKWSFATGYWIYSSPAIGPDGTIYIGSYDDRLYAINPTGTLKWIFPTGGDIYASPAISSEGIIYIASYDGKIYALYPNGTEKWNFITGGYIRSSPAIDSNGYIYFGAADGYFYALGSDSPSPPLNLKTVAGGSYVNLSWNPPADNGGAPITEYRIYRSTSSGNETFLASVDGNTTWYNDTSVTNGITYYYYVTAVNGVGESDPSEEVNETPRSIPAPPENLEAYAGNCYVNLTWSPPADDGGAPITEYRIYRSTSLGNEQFLAVVSSEITWYNDTLVANGITYYYYVTAVNEVGESNPSNEVNVTVPSVPTPPQDVQASAGDEYVYLQWSPPADDGGIPVTAYRIYRGVSLSSMFLLVEIPSAQIEYTDTSVNNGVTYYYYITAVNDVGESEPSETVSARPVGPPDPPQNLRATAGDEYVLLTWEAPDDGGLEIIEYRIYRYVDSGSPELIANVTGTSLSYNDTSVTNGVRYHYYVIAVNSAGTSDPSDTVDAWPVGVPGAPTNLTAEAGDGYVILMWAEPEDDGGTPVIIYNIYRGTSPESMELVAQVPYTNTSYRDTSVENGVTYYYYVTAVNIVGESGPSDIVDAKPEAPPFYEPSSPTFVLFIVSLGAVAAVVALLFLLKRRRREEPEVEMPEGPEETPKPVGEDGMEETPVRQR